MPLGLSYLFCHEYVPTPRSRTFVDSIPHLVGRRTVPQERRNERHGIFYIACQMQFDVLVRSLHCARHLEEIVSLLVAMLP